MDSKWFADVDWPSENIAAREAGYVMDRASRNELLRTVENLKDQLQQYKNKLRDVVAAYKSLAKEKEALEASLAALTSCPGMARDRPLEDAAGSKKDPNASVTASCDMTADPLGTAQAPADDGSSQMKALKDQLRILTVSMATLTQEKNRMETQFLADNKQLRQDNDELQRKAEEDRVLWNAKKETLEQQIQELKNRIRGLQLEREKEQTDYAVMLRELQKLLSEERLQKEALELQLDEIRRTLQEQNTNNIVLEEYEKKTRELSQELNSVRDRMQKAEIKASQPSPFVLELQKEMADMKSEHQRIVSQEQLKAVEAECRLQQHSKQSEERISSLEEKLSELSEVVGNYERLRFQDQQAINKLKERVTQLDIENTALVQGSKTYCNSDEDENLDAQALFDQILHLKKSLVAASQKSETPLDLSALFTLENQVKSDCTSCERLKEELEQLKEDYERYKLRAQSVLKNKHKEKSSSKEVEVLKEQVSDLRDRLKVSSAHHQEEVEQLQLKIDSLSRSMLAQADAHKGEVAHIKNAHQKEIFVLEQEAKKQRERTVALLAEKDQEIENLRSSSHDYLSRVKDLSLESLRDGDGLLQGDADVTDTVTQLLMHPSAQGEATLLHFAQEKARQDVEMMGLRRHKHQLENALRELQHSMSLNEEKSQEALQKLEEQIHKLERDKSRESANLEYLKNVFLKFLISTSYDSHGRTQMLKAIATILQFSPAEKDLVKSSVHIKL